MNANITHNKQRLSPDVRAGVLKRFVQVIIIVVVQAVTLFISAGRLDWVWAWAYLGVGVGILAINVLVMPPELIAERGRADKEGIKSWDRVVTTLLILPTLGTPIMAGLDERFGWSPPLALAIQVVALVVWALGQGLFTWAMVSNKFFSTAVRIQTDRGHTVASSGPYRYVRHPGYVGYIVFLFATSVALGSLWALIPAGLGMCLFVVRTALEDRTLQDELDGYKKYAQQVHYRLLPGVW
ncbi:MAG: isoprenylcysteine carboxylmethyltransferase family protein [Anaerolineae bacterium]